MDCKLKTEKMLKSKNHAIKYKRADNIKTCDLHSNCFEITWNISKNHLFSNVPNNHSTIKIFDKLPSRLPNQINENFESESITKNAHIYESINFYLLIVLFVMTLYLKQK